MKNNPIKGNNEDVLERSVEYLIYASRWLLVPIFVGLIGLLFVLILKFYQEFFAIFMHIGSYDKTDLTLKSLHLVDMALIASLLVMVAISGYENFVSKLDNPGADNNKPSFFSKIDPGTIKIKLALSIVAISSINLLQTFLAVENFTEAQIFWKTIIHGLFLISAIATAFVDLLQKKK